MKQAVYCKLKESTQNVIYPVYDEKPIGKNLCESLNYDLNSIVSSKLGEVTVVHTLGKFDFNQIIFVGMGSIDCITTKKMRTAFEKVSAQIKEPASFLAKKAVTDHISLSTVVELFVETYLLTTYQETKCLENKKDVICVDVMANEDVTSAIKKAQAYADGINYARDLANTPANYMTPERLVEEAKSLGMECEILDKEQLVQLGAGGILSVNLGSDLPPYMICLKYQGANESVPFSALVGKAITFDSGGYNIKGNSYGMKYDMCGGADVLGVMKILNTLKPQCNVYGVIPATENLINGAAYKPQDVIVTMAKKTVEIVSTDAEGRLILCDGLTYAQSLGNVNRIVDIATLTGACFNALGNVYTGVFSNSDRYYNDLVEAMNESDEKGWRLPLDDEYFDMLKCSSADMKNSSGKPGGGASVAACFLNEFINEGVEWIHLDIAGVANDQVNGASGTMVRTLVHLVQK